MNDKSLVKLFYPNAFCCQKVVTDDDGHRGLGYWIYGTPYDLNRVDGSIERAWAVMAEHIRSTGETK